MKNSINQEKCKKCKLCIEVCPVNIIGIDDKSGVHFIKERESICLKCGQCMAICSTEAIQVNGFSYNNDFFPLPENKVDYRNFIDFLANRRSVRNFKDKPVPDELIHQILEVVSFAPYGAEPEKVNITVVNNREKMELALPAIAEFLDNVVKWVENPIASFMIKRKKGAETFNTIKNHLYPISKLKNYKLEYGDRITRNAPAIIIFHAPKGAEEHTNNSLIYATYSMLAAHSLGLGATIIGIVPAAINKVKEVREVFQIPEENEAIISVIIGYPKYKYRKSIKRRGHNINWIK
ncbi:MAG: nitroreductase family protein [Bacteroidales bacterium]|nr:nitroreductase family protein [Bacteroidales bacterium]